MDQRGTEAGKLENKPETTTTHTQTQGHGHTQSSDANRLRQTHLQPRTRSAMQHATVHLHSHANESTARYLSSRPAGGSASEPYLPKGICWKTLRTALWIPCGRSSFALWWS